MCEFISCWPNPKVIRLQGQCALCRSTETWQVFTFNVWPVLCAPPPAGLPGSHHRSVWPVHPSWTGVLSVWKHRGHLRVQQVTQHLQSHLINTWTTPDQHMNDTWSTHDQHMNDTWSTHERHLIYTWTIHDQHMTCSTLNVTKWCDISTLWTSSIITPHVSVSYYFNKQLINEIIKVWNRVRSTQSFIMSCVVIRPDQNTQNRTQTDGPVHQGEFQNKTHTDCLCMKCLYNVWWLSTFIKHAMCWTCNVL